MSPLVAQSLGVRFQSIPEGCIKTPKAFRNLPQIEALKFGGTRRIVFNRRCFCAFDPCGRRRFAAADQTLLWSRLSNRFGASSKPTPPKRKTPADGEGLSFGRTRRITRNRLEPVSSPRASRHGRSVANAPVVAFDRTADLYHVKADWPHQDTRRLV